MLIIILRLGHGSTFEVHARGAMASHTAPRWLLVRMERYLVLAETIPKTQTD